MANKFVIDTVWRAHLKGLKNRDYTKEEPIGEPDRVSRAILYATPALVAGLFLGFGWKVSAPEALLAGFALLAGAFLAVFAPLAAWRDRLTDRASVDRITGLPVRDFLDAAVAHTCLAALVSALSAAVLVVGMNFADPDGSLTCGWAAAAAAAGIYLLLLLTLIVKALYAAYAQINNVRADLSGLHRN